MTFFKAALTVSIVFSAGAVLWLALTQGKAFLIDNMGPLWVDLILKATLSLSVLCPGKMNNNYIAIKQKRLVSVKKKGLEPDRLGIRPLHAGICLLMFPAGIMLQLVAQTMEEARPALYGVLEALGIALLVGGLALYIAAEFRINHYNKRNGLNP